MPLLLRAPSSVSGNMPLFRVGICDEELLMPLDISAAPLFKLPLYRVLYYCCTAVSYMHTLVLLLRSLCRVSVYSILDGCLHYYSVSIPTPKLLQSSGRERLFARRVNILIYLCLPATLGNRHRWFRPVLNRDGSQYAHMHQYRQRRRNSVLSKLLFFFHRPGI